MCVRSNVNKRFYMYVEVRACVCLVYQVQTTITLHVNILCIFNHERNRLPLRFTWCSKWHYMRVSVPFSCSFVSAFIYTYTHIDLHYCLFTVHSVHCALFGSGYFFGFSYWQNKWPISSREKNAIMITMSTIAAAAAAVKRNHNQFQMTKGITQQKHTHSRNTVYIGGMERRVCWFNRMASGDDDSAWPNIFHNVNEWTRVLQNKQFVWQCKTFGNNGSSTQKSLIISMAMWKCQKNETCILRRCIL